MYMSLTNYKLNTMKYDNILVRICVNIFLSYIYNYYLWVIKKTDKILNMIYNSDKIWVLTFTETSNKYCRIIKTIVNL